MINIPPPDRKEREEIFKVILSKMKVGDDVDIEKLAERSENCTGADIKSICNTAGQFAIRRDVNSLNITMVDFDKALVSSQSHLLSNLSSISFPSSFQPFIK